MPNHRITNKQGSNMTLAPLLDVEGNALVLAPKGTKGDEKEIDAETAENEIVTRMKTAGWVDVRPVHHHHQPAQHKAEEPPPPPPPAPEPKAEEPPPPPAPEPEPMPPPPAPEPAPEPVAPFETTLPTETSTSSETSTPPSKPKRR